MTPERETDQLSPGHALCAWAPILWGNFLSDLYFIICVRSYEFNELKVVLLMAKFWGCLETPSCFILPYKKTADFFGLFILLIHHNDSKFRQLLV